MRVAFACVLFVFTSPLLADDVDLKALAQKLDLLLAKQEKLDARLGVLEDARKSHAKDERVGAAPGLAKTVQAQEFPPIKIYLMAPCPCPAPEQKSAMVRLSNCYNEDVCFVISGGNYWVPRGCSHLVTITPGPMDWTLYTRVHGYVGNYRGQACQDWVGTITAR